jgi:hypothetical protein
MSDDFTPRVRVPKYVAWSWVNKEWIVGGVADTRREAESFPRTAVILPFGSRPPARPPSSGKAG